ncbi:MAG TPA: glycosyltransferase, partial [Calditrichia bacterium]|nr:glycosyltransferase [Calditrichia bacterium]
LQGRGKKSYLHNAMRLRKRLRENPVDIIHAHYGYCGWVSLLARRREKIVMSFMGNDLLGSVGEDGKYRLASRLESAINIFFARWFYDHCIVKSPNLRQKIKNLSHVSILPNGVNLAIFVPQERQVAREKLGLAEDGRYVLFPYPPDYYEKNYPLAEKAVNKLNDVHLLSVSGLSQGQLSDYYNGADLLIMTSFHEGSPNVVKEAMACNCPVVSVDVGDVATIVEGTKNCYITGYEAGELAAKISLVLENGKRSDGRNHIGHLAVGHVAEKLKMIYLALVEGNQ